MTEAVNEGGIVALEVVHRGAHAGETLAETKVVGGVCLGWLALRPIPTAAVLKIDDTTRAYAIDYDFCKGCGICAAECPCGAIEMVPEEV